MMPPAPAERKGAFAKGSGPWIVLGAGLVVAPLIFTTSADLTVLSLMVVAIVFALSYNILFGQTGLLSFGHAVYYGLGAYFTMHALNYLATSHIPYPVELTPLLGGLAGLFFGIVLGIISVRRAGISFAMISFGIGILVAALALILRHWFGGDGGLSGDPTAGTHILGLTLVSHLQIYYLMAAWCALSVAIMYFLTTTPLGQMANAVRDNPERVQFMGYNAYQIRLRMHSLAGFFAGIAGGMAALTNGIVAPDALGFLNSGDVLVMVYIGGATVFFGPVFGAIILTYMQVELSNYTAAWQLYLGLLFVLVVIYAPDGVAGIVKAHMPVIRHRKLAHLAPGYLLVAVPGAVLLLGLAFLVQMGYAVQGAQIFLTQSFSFAGFSFDDHNTWTWIVALAITAGAFLACRPGIAMARRGWDRLTEEMKAEAASRLPQEAGGQ